MNIKKLLKKEEDEAMEFFQEIEKIEMEEVPILKFNNYEEGIKFIVDLGKKGINFRFLYTKHKKNKVFEFFVIEKELKLRDLKAYICIEHTEEETPF